MCKFCKRLSHIHETLPFIRVNVEALVEGTVNSAKYINILEENLWPVKARHFPQNDYIFMDDNVPVHRAWVVKIMRKLAK